MKDDFQMLVTLLRQATDKQARGMVQSRNGCTPYSIDTTEESHKLFLQADEVARKLDRERERDFREKRFKEYCEDIDMHGALVDLMFKSPDRQEQSQFRHIAKKLNFLYIGGAGTYTIAKHLCCSYKQAEEWHKLVENLHKKPPQRNLCKEIEMPEPASFDISYMYHYKMLLEILEKEAERLGDLPHNSGFHGKYSELKYKLERLKSVGVV